MSPRECVQLLECFEELKELAFRFLANPNSCTLELMNKNYGCLNKKSSQL